MASLESGGPPSARVKPRTDRHQRRLAARQRLLRLPRKLSFYVGSVLLALVVGPALLASILPIPAPGRQDLSHVLQAPVWLGGDWSHPLGTDGIGRDLLSRLCYGARTSLAIAAIALVLAIALGLMIGGVAGLVGGRIESVLTRIVEIQIGFPFIILALTLLTVFPITFYLVVLVLVLATWGAYARTFRAMVLGEKQQTYVLAARAVGASLPRILVNHVFRTLTPTIVALAAVDLTYLVTLEAALSFVGLGVQPPTASLGNILGEGKQYLDSAWWVATFPGIALVFFSVGLNLIADSIDSTVTRTAS
jgi:peptide/nickel transport system permease protein